MRKLRIALLGIVAALGLSCGSVVTAQSYLPGPWSLDQKRAEALFSVQGLAWGEACALKGIKPAMCAKLPPPRVSYGFLPMQYGGYKIGSYHVVIDVRIMGQSLSGVIMVHEMIHYIQDLQRKDGPVSIAEECAAEKEAFNLSVAWARRSGLAKDDPRLKDWADLATDSPPGHPVHTYDTYGCKP